MRANRPPVFPETCNITHVQQQAYYWYYQFLEDNAPCLADFTECIQVNSTQECYSPCMTSASDLANACGLSQAVYCNIDGQNSGVSGHSPFEFHSATCVPAACDDGYHDQLLAYLQYSACADAYWTPNYCSSIKLTCAYQLKSSSVWKIVGIAVGAVLGVFILCIIAYCCYRRKIQRAQDEEFDPDVDEDDESRTDAGALLLRQQQEQFERWSAARGGSVQQ